MTIDSHNLQPTVKNRLQTLHLLILEFALEELPGEGSPGQTLYLSLFQNYFNKKDLHFERIQFNLKNKRARVDHVKYVFGRVKELKKV